MGVGGRLLERCQRLRIPLRHFPQQSPVSVQRMLPNVARPSSCDWLRSSTD
jgi:hypothetical protein